MAELFDKLRDRRHAGRGLLPSMLRLGFQPPVTYQEGMEAVQEYLPDELKRRGPYSPRWSQQQPNMDGVVGEPDPQAPAFSSLSGARTARHDMKGAAPLRYPQRTLATDADAPDNGYARPDSIDGLDPLAGVQQGGRQDLPTPVYASAAHRGRDEARALQAEYVRRMAVTKDPYELAALRDSTVGAAALAAQYDRDIQLGAAAGKNPLDDLVRQLDPVLQRSIAAGNLPLYEAAAQDFLGKHYKGEDGLPFAPQEYARIGRQTAMNATLMQARSAMIDHGGLAKMPPEMKMATYQNVAFLFPFRPNNPTDPRERARYISQTAAVLQRALNVEQDPEITKDIYALASHAAEINAPQAR